METLGITPLDCLIGSVLIVFILYLSPAFIRHPRYSLKSRIAWAVWLLSFLVLELGFAFDGDPTTPTLSELGVSTVGAKALQLGTWLLFSILWFHWPDLAARMRKPWSN